MAPFRNRRRLCLDYAYGRQWNRPVTLPDGRIMTEEQLMISKGQQPVTNNLTRQLIKTVVGKWRYLRAAAGSDAQTSLEDALTRNCLRDSVDARSLEEFLISGCAVQWLGHDGEPANISPARIFLSPFTREDASDCRMMGVLHDMPLPEVLRRFCHGDPVRYAALASLFAHQGSEEGVDLFPPSHSDSFDTPQSGTLRVIEVWYRRPKAMLRIHDTENGAYIITDISHADALKEIAGRRHQYHRPPVKWMADVEDVWQHCYLTPDGTVLAEETAGSRQTPTLAVRCYPMIDGEIHSLVEDVMSQQHYVNRLVMLLDEILRFSAKGVLLFPTEQLPKGMTWESLRKIWSTPGGIIPFQRTSRNIVPMQLNSAGTSAGATDMLRMQLDMFARVSGTSFATDSQGLNANSADMLRRQMEQEMVALLDVLASFHAFVCDRDARWGRKGEA